MIVDNHVHVISPDTAAYPLADGARQSGAWPRDMSATSAEQLIAAMDRSGVDKTILVQPFSYYGFDNAYHADSAARHPDRLIAVCAVDPLAEDAPEQLSYWITQRGMEGLRLFTMWNAAWVEDRRTDRLFAHAADLGIPVCVLGDQQYLSGLRALAERFPTVPLALDHLASYSTPERLPLAALDTLLGMAALPNVYAKVSTANLWRIGKGDGVRDAVLRKIFDAFGARRVMWGTNSPASQEGSYQEMAALGRTALPWLSDEERRWFLGDTAASLWPSLRPAG